MVDHLIWVKLEFCLRAEWFMIASRNIYRKVTDPLNPNYQIDPVVQSLMATVLGF